MPDNKKALEHYYMSLPYTVCIQRDVEDGGFVFWVPELQGCITQVEHLDNGPLMLSDAMLCWIRAALEDGVTIPEPENKREYTAEFIRFPKPLHDELKKRARAEGISISGLCNKLIAAHL